MVPIQKNDGINEIVLISLMFHDMLNKQPRSASIAFRISNRIAIASYVETCIIRPIRQVTTKKAVTFARRRR